MELFGHILKEHKKHNEEEILALIELRVAELLDTEPDLLMSYLYRLDVLERDIKLSMQLHNGQFVSREFAKLIWNRQKQRLETRAKYKQDPIEDWEY